MAGPAGSVEARRHGPRAKLLAAIAELAASTTKDRSPPTIEAAPLRRPAERRQITVLFCDLVDSTRLASRLDPEDFRASMEAYQNACGATVKRYGGHISQYRGDGLEVYFGWPAAQEDAAERAVHAGIAVIDAVAALSSSVPLAVRVGIDTGIAVVGEPGFGDPSIPSAAVGKTLHIAARIQSIAPANSMVIGETTSNLVSHRFIQEELGPQNLKGIESPVKAFRVIRAREESTRFQLAQSVTLTPLVGRHAELAFLQQCWDGAKEGDGQAVFISGVPGVGKSRIVHELTTKIRNDSHFTFTLQCSSYSTQTALFPIIQLLQRLANIKPGDS
jgi:class 3 adenylate cyclase